MDKLYQDDDPSRVTSTQAETTFETTTSTAISVWRASIGEGPAPASCSRGRGLPVQSSLLHWPRDPTAAKPCGYPPAEELHSSDFDPLSDDSLTDDGDLPDYLF